MVDWAKSMEQTFEYYIVEPGTWKDAKKLNTVKSCTISRDLETETLASATIDTTETVGECYVRVYLVTTQKGVTEKHPLGTFIIQTPSTSFDGKISSISMDAYSPLLELKENPPPLGYSILKNANVMENAYSIIREQARAPVVKTDNSTNLNYDFVADPNDTWLGFLNDLIINAKYSFELDELGRILFAPIQEMESLQPVWTFSDDNSSILLPSTTLNRDIYGIPNAVEVVYSDGMDYYRYKVVNDDPNSPISTVNRGREILHRITNPDLNGIPSEYQIQEYAEQTLKRLSTVEYTVTYSHGYCPVRIGDCVRLNYKAAGLKNVKAKVIKQTIKCTPGCEVSETAIFTNKLWR